MSEDLERHLQATVGHDKAVAVLEGYLTLGRDLYVAQDTESFCATLGMIVTPVKTSRDVMLGLCALAAAVQRIVELERSR